MCTHTYMMNTIFKAIISCKPGLASFSDLPNKGFWYNVLQAGHPA